MSAPNRTGIITPTEAEEEGEDVLMLVMPVMLNTWAIELYPFEFKSPQPPVGAFLFEPDFGTMRNWTSWRCHLLRWSFDGHPIPPGERHPGAPGGRRPVRQALIRCWRCSSKSGGAPFCENHRHQQPAHRTCDVAFPRNADRQWAASTRPYRRRETPRATSPAAAAGLPDHARREEEGRQRVVDATGTDVVAASTANTQSPPESR